MGVDVCVCLYVYTYIDLYGSVHTYVIQGLTRLLNVIHHQAQCTTCVGIETVITSQKVQYDKTLAQVTLHTQVYRAV